jgi:hypothetical protein
LSRLESTARSNKPMVKTMSSSERKSLIANCLTDLSLRAKCLCPDALEGSAEAFEDEDGHVRIYQPAGMSEEEIAVIEGKVADRCVVVL